MTTIAAASPGADQGEGQGRYRGPPEDAARNAGIAAMLKGASYSEMQAPFGCSRATVAKIVKRIGDHLPIADRNATGATKRSQFSSGRVQSTQTTPPKICVFGLAKGGDNPTQPKSLKCYNQSCL